jgi:hypothetical protein
MGDLVRLVVGLTLSALSTVSTPLLASPFNTF